MVGTGGGVKHGIRDILYVNNQGVKFRRANNGIWFGEVVTYRV